MLGNAPDPVLTDGTEEAKHELARELHDQVAQTLIGMLVDIRSFRSGRPVPTEVAEELDEVMRSTRQVLLNVRGMIGELRGQTEADVDLPATLRDGLLEPLRRRTGLKVRLTVGRHWPRRLRPQQAHQVYRIVQEAVTNARVHGGATRVDVALAGTPAGALTVAVKDDGPGIRAGDLMAPGHGVIGMRERAWLLGGHLAVMRGHRWGTIVRCSFPLCDPGL